MDAFREVWTIDAEFRQPDGWLPDPVCCICALELRTGREVRLWTAGGDVRPPFGLEPDNLFVGHALLAEWGAFQALGWPLPHNSIDTYVEARRAHSGLAEGQPENCGLLLTASRLGIVTASDALKTAGRALAMRGGPWSDQERVELMAYCMTDVQATAAIFVRMLPEIIQAPGDLGRALLRGLYVRAAARVERAGIPIDLDLYARIKANQARIRSRLIDEMDTRGVYVRGAFNHRNFAAVIEGLGITSRWPRTPTGRLRTDDETLKDASNAYPELSDLRELVRGLAKLKRFDLPIGQDGKHRPKFLGVFGTDTCRNAPSQFIFAQAKWVRSLIKPDPGRALVYSDFKGQELAIAASLSNDANLQAAVASGDAYCWFGKRIGLMPADATARSHPALRNRLKPVLLGSNYGTTKFGLSFRLGVSLEEAEMLLEHHKRLFPDFWRWVENVICSANEDLELRSRWGWRMAVTAETSQRSIQNHGIQTMGSHVLQFAAIGLTENKIETHAMIHDAVLTSCRLEDEQEHVAAVDRQMVRAAEVALGLPIAVDHAVYRYPDHYTDDDGVEMFDRVLGLLDEDEAEAVPEQPLQPSRPPGPSRPSRYQGFPLL